MHCQKLGQKGDLIINVSRIKRNYKGKKLLVESNRKHGFGLETLISISNYSSSFWGDIEGITFFPSCHDRSSSTVGALPFSPLTMTLAPL